MRFLACIAGSVLGIQILSGCSHQQQKQPLTRSGWAAATAAPLPPPPDTTVLPRSALQQFLPRRVQGFEQVGPAEGDLVRLGTICYTTCQQCYRRGPQQLRIRLVDYNRAPPLYASATTLMTDGTWQESEEELLRSYQLDLPNVRGYEVLHKQDRRATVALGIGSRFFVSVELTGQNDTRLAKTVVRALDLAGLSAL